MKTPSLAFDRKGYEYRRGWPVIAALIVSLVAVAGCKSARWKDASAVRQARIAGESKLYWDHEAAGPERIRETIEIDRRLSEQRAENLQYTCDLVKRMHERDVQRWRDDAVKREAALRGIWNGHPETIPDTWAKMVY